MIYLIRKDFDKSDIVQKVMNELGISAVPCSIIDSFKEKVTSLTDVEKEKLLRNLDKESISKIKSAINDIQR